MSALDALGQWPVDHVSAVYLTGNRIVAEYGDLDRVYPLASVTKLLVAEAILVAVEEGAIELDDAAGPPGSTVAHLLAHASGVAFDTREVQAPPGRARIYSSTGFEILAEVVEDATDMAFAEYLALAVCEPLGMSHTVLDGPAGHGARSTVGDLSRLAHDLMDPTILAPATLLDATKVWFPGLDGFVPGYGKHRPNDWGLGFEIASHKRPHWTGRASSPETFGHFGQSGTYLWVDPTYGDACVVLTDRPFGAWAKPLWSEFNDAVITDFRGSASSRSTSVTSTS